MKQQPGPPPRPPQPARITVPTAPSAVPADGAPAHPSPPEGSTAAPARETVSHMTYAELVGFFHQQVGRIEMTWFRVLYLHAAMVGVLVFFSQADDPFTIARAIVFGFYTVNLLVFHFALRESYIGLVAVQSDLTRFEETDGAVDRWFRSHRLGRRRPVRVLIMLACWALVAFLLSWTWTDGLLQSP